MNRRNQILGILFGTALFLVGLWFLWQTRSPLPSEVAAGKSARSDPVPAQAPPGLHTAPPLNPQQVVQPVPRGATEAEKWKWWREMSAADRFFEYKMPISFYGRVEDDLRQPVSGADIKFSWVNLSSEGTGQKSTTSDAAGNFSLTGAVGKALTVQVRKQGYKHSVSRNQSSFEYAMFAEPKYHQPDAANLIVFVLRKDREAEPLIVRKNQEATLQPGQSKSFVIGPNGATVVVERLPGGEANALGWDARVTTPGGGVTLSTEEFPFEAPEGGYEEAIVITDKTPKPPAWVGDTRASIYVKTPQGYARVVVHYIPNMDWVYVDSYFNPKPGSRNLEFDPANVIKGMIRGHR